MLPHFACFTATSKQLNVSCSLRLLLSMWTFRAAKPLKTAHKQMEGQGLRLWKCNKVVFLERSKQIRLAQSSSAHKHKADLLGCLVLLLHFFSPYVLVMNELQHLSRPSHACRADRIWAWQHLVSSLTDLKCSAEPLVLCLRDGFHWDLSCLLPP